MPYLTKKVAFWSNFFCGLKFSVLSLKRAGWIPKLKLWHLNKIFDRGQSLQPPKGGLRRSGLRIKGEIIFMNLMGIIVIIMIWL